MAVEPRRGCGYRKIGALYLVGDAAGVPCDRLPIALTVCPCCSAGIKQSRGWTWIDVALLLNGAHADCRCPSFRSEGLPLLLCPLCVPEIIGRAGLLWIGERFYRTPADFDREAKVLGISRRIAAVPRGFKLGDWILLAHRKVMPTENGLLPGIFRVWQPQRIEKIVPESARGADEARELVVVPDDDPDHS